MPRTTRSPLIVIAASASAAAGLVHAGAAGSHAELGTLATLFALMAVLQIGWAAVAWTRRNTAVVLTGAGIQAVALATLVLSRTIGISWVEGLDSGTTVAFQDGLIAGLEAVALLAALASLAPVRTTRTSARLAPVFAVAMVLAAVPAMATPHDHDDHDDHDDHVVTEVAATSSAAQGLSDDGHPHDDHGDEHGHDDHATTGQVAAPAETPAGTAADEDLPYPASFAGWLDTAETPEQRAAAEQLLVETTEAMKAFPDEAAVQAAGFISIGDGATGWEHYINIERIADPRILDPDDIESIVLKVNPDGTKEVASAMYLLPFGTTMADAPDIAGDLTPWHDHQNLCWEGARVVGTTGPDGSCARGEFRPTQPMIHVWVIEHECGPFAGIEGGHGSGCAHEH